MILIFLSINAILVSIAITIGFSVGYVMRTMHLRSLRKRVYELESEMLRNHAEILDLQRAVANPKKPASHAYSQKADPYLVSLDKIKDVQKSATGKTGS